MTSWAGAILLLATMTVGLMAGVFAAFAFSVMPGLAGTGDATFVEVMQRINVAIINGWFLLCFLGGIVFTAGALVLGMRAFPAGAPGRAAVPWIVAGLALYGVALLVTFAVNVPLNNALVAAGSPGTVVDAAAARAAFEARWVAFNIARAVAGTAAFGCLGWALHLAGRGTVA